MAQTKKKSTSKAEPEKISALEKSPFKTKKSTAPIKQQDNILTPPPEVAEAVDAFRTAQDQAKFYEGEATVHKNTVVDYATTQFAHRLFQGESSGFKIQGNESMTMFVVQDAGSGLSEEDVEEFTSKWGKQAAEELIVRDYGSIRFNESVLEANYEAVVAALETLEPEILENLFKPMSLKAKKGSIEAARRHVKNKEELREILSHLKIRQYVR